MSKQRFEGRSAAEAAIKACERLGLTRSELEYEIVEETGEGIDRRVVIEVNAAAAPAPRPAPEVEYHEDNGATSDEEPPLRSSGRPARAERADRGGREGGRRGGRSRDRGGRDRDRDRDRGGRGRDGRRGGRGGRSSEQRANGAPKSGIDDLLNMDAFANLPVEERADLQGDLPERAKAAREVVAEMIAKMGLDLSVHLVHADNDEIHIDIRGADHQRLVGSKFEALLNLQFLVNRIVSRKVEGEGIVVIDVGGYRAKRRAALADLAKRLADRAVEEQKVVKLSPMSAHDRRVFHLTLTELEGVTTRSEGDGMYRNLLIIPAAFAEEAH